MGAPLRIGVDFDNTIVCYDQVFHQVALEQGLIPPTLPVSKGGVRDHLRSVNNEDAWTAMPQRMPPLPDPAAGGAR